jgi:hypothetical protein
MSLPESLRCIGVVFAASVGLSGCVASHDVAGQDQGLSPDGSTAGSAANGGAGGTRSAGGSGATSVSCGSDKCPGGNVFGQALPGCCTSDNKCGMDVASLGFGAGCAEMNAPGAVSAACPSQNLGGFLPLDGCCRPDGTCGVLDTFAGLGCTNVGATQTTRCTP